MLALSTCGFLPFRQNTKSAKTLKRRFLQLSVRKFLPNALRWEFSNCCRIYAIRSSNPLLLRVLARLFGGCRCPCGWIFLLGIPRRAVRYGWIERYGSKAAENVVAFLVSHRLSGRGAIHHALLAIRGTYLTLFEAKRTKGVDMAQTMFCGVSGGFSGEV